MKQEIPYKIYLEEQEMPRQWYNVRADMKKKPAPILNPGTLKPVTFEELSGIFVKNWRSRSWMTQRHILTFPRRSWTFTGCTGHLLW